MFIFDLFAMLETFVFQAKSFSEFEFIQKKYILFNYALCQ